MSCKIDVLQRIRDAAWMTEDTIVKNVLEMAARKIESLEKNHGFKAEMRAKIASEQMASANPELSMSQRAAYGVRCADALIEELTKNDH